MKNIPANQRKHYAFYKKNNPIKARYHKVSMLFTAITLFLLLAPLNPYLGGFFAIMPLLSIVFSGNPQWDKFTMGVFGLNTFNCNYGLGNSGTDCTPNLGAPKMMIMTPYFNEAQGQNRFALKQPGTIYVAASSPTLTGIGTTFTTTFTVGDIVVLNNNPQVYVILSISSDTVMTATVNSVLTQATPGVNYNSLQNQAFFNALTNHPNPNRRWYPIPFVKNGDNIRATDIMQVWEDNTEEDVMQGVRKIMGIVPKTSASPQLSGKLKTYAQTDLGVYILDYANNLHIVDILDGFAYPIRADQNSFVSVFNPGKIKEGMKIDVSFNVHSNEIDANLNAISASTFGSTVNIGALKGLKDVSVLFTGTDGVLTTMQLTLTTLFGDAVTPTQIHGLTAANFFSVSTGLAAKVWDVTSAADLAISSAVEQKDGNGKPNGVYVVTFATATDEDVLQFGIQQNGADFSAVNVATVIIT